MDYYLLPYIDQLVDLAIGHQFISIMNAYHRYYQISLIKADQNNINFITAKSIFLLYYHVIRAKKYQSNISKVYG